MIRSLRAAPRLVALIVVAAATGCSNAPAVVSGKVTCGGKTVNNGEIHFIPESGVPRSSLISPDGEYRVEGLPAGPCAVSILAPEVQPITALPPVSSELAGPAKQVEVKRPPPRSLIPAKYNETATSGLRPTLTGKDQTLNFELDAK